MKLDRNPKQALKTIEKSERKNGPVTQVAVELPGETKAAGSAGQGCRDQVVQISVGRGGQFQGSEALES